ncbi:YceI family protein [Methylobacterium gnaphalii]|uniref:Polyisoprenoid-binding protein n=1 Tax=Methylobacterium gnaphalii TaxID=1010610 RepID=A0A512JMB1_9HYPH|nr:YceI family protein [Methylobacterium gnaphalii]GEP11042.1 polyisoprenoid-binding protein [Methylobacterium gnaphalii]GJD69618.1 Protein YceI [Methylobacterium gnaphalii]GLS50320.1 polyisoprenoid-binding protein [Methylobacterium gnaphalii]
MKPLAALALLALIVALPLDAWAQAEAAGPSTDPTQVRPGRYRLDPAHGKITWSLNHLGYSTYYGQITDVAAEATLDPREPAKSRLSVTINTASVNGLNERLNEHLRSPDFFDVEKFPQASYVSTSIERTSPTTARVNGELTIKGITRVVSFDATFNQAGINPVDKAYTVGFDGRAVIRRSDFGISAFLPVLGDEVQLRLEGEFKAAP